MDEQEVRPNKLRRFLKETTRVLRITKRPNREEYKSLLKVTGLGICIIGALGFVIFLIAQLFF
ncbi:protein translocase SEC61 complex subunit gamma [Candidatus Woesearchaeota archaeon CG_4_10_14_0_2_um_filter_33_13]|nr:MAG: protein translocase SEC61 complex subunit gamma [Candidatus Woesearchaeota archaeon CG_4_10_14_0_2_um_filter_33_13]